MAEALNVTLSLSLFLSTMRFYRNNTPPDNGVFMQIYLMEIYNYEEYRNNNKTTLFFFFFRVAKKRKWNEPETRWARPGKPYRKEKRQNTTQVKALNEHRGLREKKHIYSLDSSRISAPSGWAVGHAPPEEPQKAGCVFIEGRYDDSREKKKTSIIKLKCIKEPVVYRRSRWWLFYANESVGVVMIGATTTNQRPTLTSEKREKKWSNV